MKSVKRLMVTALIGVMGLSLAGCKMIQKTPEAIAKTVVAKVGNEKITKGDVDKELKPYLDMYEQQVGKDYEKDPQVMEQLKGQREQVLNSLVDEKIMLQKAKDLNLIPAEEELNKKIEENTANMKAMYGSDEEFEKIKESYGYTDETFKEFMKNQVIVQAVIEHINKDINTSDEELKKKYDESIANYTGADVAHILIKDEAKAKEVRERAANGEDFAALAKEFSEDPGSKDNGGSYGFIPSNSTQYVPEFVNGFKDLKEGEISQPVQSSHGYHIIKATNVGVKKFEDVKDTMKQEIEKEAKNKAYTDSMEQWKKDLSVKLYTDKL